MKRREFSKALETSMAALILRTKIEGQPGKEFMRRIIATLVLSVIAWGTLAPFVMATTANKTPPCCRRDGKHHCQMEMQSAESHASHEPNLRTTATGCPYRNLLPVPTATSLPHFTQPLGRTVPVVSYVFFKTIPPSLPFSISSLGQRGPPRSSL